MLRLRFLSGALASATLLGACAEATSPSVHGRWAAKGIELIAQPFSAEVRLPCATMARVARALLPDSAGTIRFSAPVTGRWTSYTVDFVGQFMGDTLAGTLTSTFAEGTPLVQFYTMVPDADPQFGSFFCLD